MDGVIIKPPDTIIDGVKVIPLRRIADQRGAVYHMLKATDPHFLTFGELYFSSVYPGMVKAWKKHKRVTVNYACIFGRIKLVLYDDRASSPTRSILLEVLLGPDNHYSLVHIPPGVWNGFQGMSQPMAILAICATEPHDPSEFDRLDPSDSGIPYNW